MNDLLDKPSFESTEIESKTKQDTLFKLIGWLVTLALPLYLFFNMPKQVVDLAGSEGVTFLALIVGAVSMWVFRLTPNFVPSLLVTILAVVLNLAPREVVMAGFGSNVIFLVLGMFLFAALMSTSGLARRISLWLTTRLPNNRFTQPFILFGLGASLSSLIPSPLGRSAIMTPLALDLTRLSDNPHRHATLQISSMQGSFLLCTIFLTGNPLNFVMLGFLDMQTQFYFQWGNWLQSTLIAGVILLIFYLLWMLWRCRHEQTVSSSEIKRLKQELQSLGGLDNKEKGAVIAMMLLVGSILSMSLHHIELAWVALFIAMTIFLFDGLTIEDMRSRVDWPTLLFIASIVSWGPMIQHLNLDQLALDHLKWLGTYISTSPLSGILLLSLVVFGIRLFFPGPPTFVILMSVLISVSGGAAMSPWVLGFCLLLLSESFIFSYQHGVSAQVSAALNDEKLLHKDMQKAFLTSNIWFCFARVVALCASLAYWSQQALI
ncbi:SLC13 family permease [Marinomonas sp. THO17]|uniref:SLC13 family permease n=1 Tax=Marinomonas sp. THO17 TaxID=3149048 RepID=UPI00336BE879